MKNSDYLVTRLRDLDDDAFVEVLESVSERSVKTEKLPNDELVHIADMTTDLTEIRQNKGKFKGFSTGFSQLDDKMGGLELGSVTLISGETSNGKSALAANVAVNIAKSGVPTLYISLEMTHKQMLERLDTITGGDPLNMDMMFQKSFVMDYRDLEPLVRRAGKLGVQLVVLDYLQYLGRGMSQDEVARMSKTIKALALTYNIALLVIVSLRKSGINLKRKWYETEIEEIMGTAAVGYDCDTAVVVSRKDTQDEFQNDAIFIKVLKTRNTRLDYHDRIVELKWLDTRITEEWLALDKVEPTSYSAKQNAERDDLINGHESGARTVSIFPTR